MTSISCPSLYVLVIVFVAYFPGWMYLGSFKWYASPHTPHLPLLVDHWTLNPPQFSSLSVSCLGVSKPYRQAEFRLGGSISRPWPRTRATKLSATKTRKIAIILQRVSTLVAFVILQIKLWLLLKIFTWSKFHQIKLQPLLKVFTLFRFSQLRKMCSAIVNTAFKCKHEVHNIYCAKNTYKQGMDAICWHLCLLWINGSA